MKIACTGCGANIVFLPNQQKCYCEYCGKLISIEDLNKYNFENGENFDKNEYDQYVCVSCGAKLIVTDNGLITDCVYCGSRQLTKTKSTFYHKPVNIIPFKTNKNYFIKSCYDYIRNSKYFSKEYNNINVLVTKGIYIPCMIERSFVEADFNLKIDWDYITETINRDYNYYNSVSTQEIIAIQDASIKISDDLLEKIENYNFNEMKKFNLSYLTGFIVENANETEERIQTKAEDKCIQKINQEILNDFEKKKRKVGYTDSIGGKVNFSSSKSINILLPVWFAKMEGCPVEFIMNGQTGKIHCIAPFIEDRYETKKIYKIVIRKKLQMIFVIFLIFFAPCIPILINPRTTFEEKKITLLFFGPLFLPVIGNVIRAIKECGKEQETVIATKKHLDCISLWNRRKIQFLKLGKDTTKLRKEGRDLIYISVYRNKKLKTRRKVIVNKN